MVQSRFATRGVHAGAQYALTRQNFDYQHPALSYSRPDWLLSKFKWSYRPPILQGAGMQLDIGPFRQGQGIVNVYAQVSNCVFDVGVA